MQLSLPEGVDEALSKTADRAKLGKRAFQNAKQQLMDEGYVHEWREQGLRGLWCTRQLVSNVPLAPSEAARVRDGAELPVPSEAPTAVRPAAGEPDVRSVGRHPDKTLEENTPVPPPPAPPEAVRVVDDLLSLDDRLRVPRAMLPELAGLAARWLEGGHSIESVREEIARSLPSRQMPIHRPGGLLRYALKHVAPVPVPQAPPPPPRVAAMRECEGDGHVQPLLFRPVGDEDRCRECRLDQAAADAPVEAPGTPPGPALLRAALRAGR
ncbi:hypothetical protein [Streptomyces solicathayae]|uniref:Uncharacterized protein n=1 Tax=Streptomyces solicathayae TaxID=3081768 RepID=A0ABZ0LS09_9ACTN|nr:hypothetical protein [Streptomyces sp. HUAS YS2]WOX22246.1 hypothetical protein R2D22_12940 [Streptomyces sp. HUAS YS2]